MKIKLYSFLALFILGVQLFVQAQAPDAPQNQAKPTTEEPTKRKAGTNGIGFGLMFGTDGAGISLGKCISKNGKMYFMASGMYAPVTLTAFPYKFGSTDVIVDADIKLGRISAVFEYHPFSNAFKISAGAAYMLTNIGGTIMVRDSSSQGDIRVAPSEIGDIKFGLKTNPVVPYFGIGFGRAVPKGRVGFNFELGAYYITSPIVSLKGSGMLEPSSVNEPVLKENLSGFSLLPAMNFRLNFKIGK
jgi:hypothetical protein